MSNDNKTNVDDFIGELGAGVIKEKLALVISEAALGTVLHGGNKRKGKVSVEFTFQQVGDMDQVIVTSKICNSVPTSRGKRSLEDATDTPMFVGKGGVVTINPPKEDTKGQFGLKQERDGIHRVK
jgi:hypothetical protein